MVSDIDLALHFNTDAGEKDFGVKGEYAFGMIPVGGRTNKHNAGLRPCHFSFQSLGKASFPRAFHEKCPFRGIVFVWRRERDYASRDRLGGRTTFESRVASLPRLFSSRPALKPSVRHVPVEKSRPHGRLSRLAEREGFEPPEACASTVFKTAAIDHSAISPRQK
jgi:hypothetical protein